MIRSVGDDPKAVSRPRIDGTSNGSGDLIGQSASDQVIVSRVDILGDKRWVMIHGDNREVLPTLADKSVAHVITDPPYSEQVHASRHSTATRRGGYSRGQPSFGSKFKDLGFISLDPLLRTSSCVEFSRLTSRWVLVFADPEGVTGWGCDLEEAGMDRVRTGAWIKLGGQPQLSGDRPAAGYEAVQVAHAKGRKRWNGGGHVAVWTHPIAKAHNLAQDRTHATQKPVELMLELVSLFTDPDDIVLDPFAGSGTTGVACLRLGRRFIGIEKDEKYAAVATERLEAESKGLSLRDARAGQLPMFEGAP